MEMIEQPLPLAPAPISVDPHLIVLTAIVAHQMGILTQQGPASSPSYRDSLGRPDAIGCSLPLDFALYYNNVPVPALPLDPRLPLDDLTNLSLLQLKSDQWARDPSNPRREKEFLGCLDQLRSRYASPSPS